VLVRVALATRERRPAGLKLVRRRAVIAAVPAAFLVLASLAAGCRRPASSTEDLQVKWRVTPAPASVGQATVTLGVRDAAGRPVPGARLRLEGHMTHPGMAPVVADLRERAAGEYEAAIAFSMAGDWVLVLTGELADGRRIHREMNIGGVRNTP